MEFLLEPASVTKVLGAAALLPCVVAGYPAPHVRWMFGDKLVEERYERDRSERLRRASVLRATSCAAVTAVTRVEPIPVNSGLPPTFLQPRPRIRRGSDHCQPRIEQL